MSLHIHRWGDHISDGTGIQSAKKKKTEIPLSIIRLSSGESAFDTATSTLDTDVTGAFDFALGLLPVTAFTCLGASQPSAGEIDRSTYPLASPPGGHSHSHICGGGGVLAHSMGVYANRLSTCVVHFPRTESSAPVHAKTFRACHCLRGNRS